MGTEENKVYEFEGRIENLTEKEKEFLEKLINDVLDDFSTETTLTFREVKDA